eukprot:TRINITY_DN1831_c0_g1_i3.p1 TRINITY_DN1831_c0_g1~~TRINITY_DN1831_c0_g1_i3.p1  ORF type:complete len:563 (+),score=100.44 TRINITY_DN1831_c0_g1_i3:185-1690(+)
MLSGVVSFALTLLGVIVIIANVTPVVGQPCCLTYNLPRNGLEYRSIYGTSNATDVHLCFDGGSTQCYDVWPVTLVNTTEYLQVNPLTNHGQYCRSQSTNTAIETTSFSAIRLVIQATAIFVKIVDFTFSSTQVINPPLYHANGGVTMNKIALGIGYSCLPPYFGVGSCDVTGTSLQIDFASTYLGVQSVGGSLYGNCYKSPDNLLFNCSGGGICGGAGPSQTPPGQMDDFLRFFDPTLSYPAGWENAIKLTPVAPYPSFSPSSTISFSASTTKTPSAASPSSSITPSLSITPSSSVSSNSTKSSPSSAPTSTPSPTVSSHVPTWKSSAKTIKQDGCFENLSFNSKLKSKCKETQVEQYFTKKMSKTTTVVQMPFGKEGNSYGRLTFPPNTVPPGCTLYIQQQTSQVTDKYKDDPCTEVSPSSPVWDIQLKGCDNNQLQGEIQIELLGVSTAGNGESCIGYAREKEETPNTQRWECLSQTRKEDGTDDVSVYSSTTDHFTFV